MSLKDKTAIVGVGATPYYRRGESVPQTSMELAGKAVIAALDDAGLTVNDLDGFALYSMGFDTSLFAQWLGVPDVKFTAMLTGGGGGAAGSVGLASAGIVAGMADVVVSVMTLQQAASRFGASFAPRGTRGAVYSAPPSPEATFIQPSGLMGPGQMFAVLAQRHMHLYGTTEEQLGWVSVAQREWAQKNPRAVFRDPMTISDYLAQPYIVAPLRRSDLTVISDGGTAVVVTTAERARELPKPPVYLLAIAQQSAIRNEQNPEKLMRPWLADIATQLYARAHAKPSDVDLAYLQDGTSVWVLQMLEWYGFCSVGEAGAFVQDGRIELGGELPVNTNGGQLSESYMWGWLHLVEAVRQLRGECGERQVEDANVLQYCSQQLSGKAASTILGSEATA